MIELVVECPFGNVHTDPGNSWNLKLEISWSVETDKSPEKSLKSPVIEIYEFQKLSLSR